MKSKRLISAVLASLGAFGSLKAAGGGKNNTESQSGGSEVLINKNAQSRNKLQGVGNSKPSVKNPKTKMKMLGARKPNISNSQQKRRGKNVGKGNKNVNFVDKSLKDNNSARKRSWSTPQKATAGVVGGLVGTTLVVGPGYGIYRWVNGAPCELLKNMDVSGLVTLNDSIPYCIKVKYKEENGVVYYHCYKFFLVFGYEKNKKGDINRNKCYVALKIIEESKGAGAGGASSEMELPLVGREKAGCRYFRLKNINEEEFEKERGAIEEALDFVFGKIIENEVQHMKDNSNLYKEENKEKLKGLMGKMVGNNFGERGMGTKSAKFFDFTQLNVEEMNGLKKKAEEEAFALKEVGNIGDPCYPEDHEGYDLDDKIEKAEDE